MEMNIVLVKRLDLGAHRMNGIQDVERVCCPVHALETLSGAEDSGS